MTVPNRDAVITSWPLPVVTGLFRDHATFDENNQLLKPSLSLKMMN